MAIGNPLTRFLAKVDMAGDKDCWEWTAAVTDKGYGRFGRGGRAGKMTKAHRFAFEIWRGPIPEGMWVLHTCDNPPCVNPAHLWLGTSDDNIADMVAKQRQKGAVNSPRKVLA